MKGEKVTDLDGDRKTGVFAALAIVLDRADIVDMAEELLRQKFALFILRIAGDERIYEVFSRMEHAMEYADDLEEHTRLTLRTTILLRDPWQAEVGEYVSLDVLNESAITQWHEDPDRESWYEETRHFARECIGWRRTE